MIGQGGEEGMQWVRVIDGALQEWEAKHVKPGPSLITCATGYLDADDARGIRRPSSGASRLRRRTTYSSLFPQEDTLPL